MFHFLCITNALFLICQQTNLFYFIVIKICIYKSVPAWLIHNQFGKSTKSQIRTVQVFLFKSRHSRPHSYVASQEEDGSWPPSSRIWPRLKRHQQNRRQLNHQTRFKIEHAVYHVDEPRRIAYQTIYVDTAQQHWKTMNSWPHRTRFRERPTWLKFQALVSHRREVAFSNFLEYISL